MTNFPALLCARAKSDARAQYEAAVDSGKTVVSVLDPETMVTLTGRKDIEPLARQARDKVVAALEAV